MKINIPYGKTNVSISIPDKNLLGVLHPKRSRIKKSESRIIKDAILNPMGCCRLKDLVSPKETIGIVVPDLTRRCPRELILPILLDELKKGGIEDKDITIFMAIGMHRPLTKDEIKKAFRTLALKYHPDRVPHEKKKEAVNKEVETPAGALEKKAIEVGNIFSLGTKFSDPYLNFHDQAGNKQFVIMGSYGIGLGRLMGTVVEVLSDEKGIVWPKEVAPFRVHLIALGDVKELADEAYKTLEAKGIETLYDDRDARAGEKFADADLIGIPTRVVIGEKSLESKTLEVKERTSEEVKYMTIENLIAELKK